MAYVFGEVWPLVIVALLVGVAIGWWIHRGVVRDHDHHHEAEIAEREDRIAVLESQASILGATSDDLATARARIVQLEGETALMDDLRARIAGLEREVADGAALRARIAELEPEAGLVPGLREEAAQLEEKVAELESFRTRFVSADREASTLRARVAELESEDRLPALQGRISELESAARERDALRGRAADLERQLAAAQDAGGAQEVSEARRELERLQARHREEVAMVAAARQEADALRRRLAELESGRPAGAAPAAFASAPAEPEPGPVLDLHRAARVLGMRVRMDDLTMVEGIGPKIGRLCREAGIGTWRAMSGASVDRLREILDGAGPNYRMHDPTTWPRQAALLADGRWEDFKAYTAELRAGRG